MSESRDSFSNSIIEIENDVNELSCRICCKSGTTSTLITPCNCQGDYAYVHPSCLSEWLEATCHVSCDICRFTFIVNRRKKGICDWLREDLIWEEIYYVIIIASFVVHILILSGVVCLAPNGKLIFII